MRPTLIDVIAILFISLTAFAKEVDLKWKAIEDTQQYELEVSRTENFENTVVRQKTKDTFYKAKLKVGTYFLRVRGVDRLERPGEWSSAFKVVVTPEVESKSVATSVQKIQFYTKPPSQSIKWDAKEGGGKYLVTIFKDQKEISKEEVGKPEFSFSPQSPGDYKVVVKPLVDGVLGKSLDVAQFQIVKMALQAPKWESKFGADLNVKKLAELKWTKADGAEYYNVVVKKVTESGEKVVESSDTKAISMTLPPLKAGKYIASVEAKIGSELSATSDKLEFEVHKIHAVEFEQVDLAFRFLYQAHHYKNETMESNNFNEVYATGIAGEVDGCIWLPNSSFGIMGGSTWSTASYDYRPITSNDLFFAGAYKSKFERGSLKFYLGPRIWSVPMFYGNLSQGISQVEIYNPTFLGVTWGIEGIADLSPKVKAYGIINPTVNVAGTSLGGAVDNATRSESKVSVKLEFGFKFPTKSGLKINTGFQAQSYEAQWDPVTKPAGSTQTGNSYLRLDTTSAVFGLESSDDESSLSRSTFTDFELSLKYLTGALNYSSNREEVQNSNLTDSFKASSTSEIEGIGWLTQSQNGIRVSTGWERSVYGSHTFAHSRNSIQWAYKKTKSEDSNWQLVNYLGTQLWHIPIFARQSSGDGVAKVPQVLGPSDKLELSRRLFSFWKFGLSTEIAFPLFITSSDTSVDVILRGSYWSQSLVELAYLFTPEFSISINGGYKYQLFNYESTNTRNPSTIKNYGGVFGGNLNFRF